MTASINYLPIWKKNATAEERFLEIAAIARKHPERFNKILVVYEEELPDKNTVTHCACHNASTTELLGLLELGKYEIMKVVTA